MTASHTVLPTAQVTFHGGGSVASTQSTARSISFSSQGRASRPTLPRQSRKVHLGCHTVMSLGTTSMFKTSRFLGLNWGM